jgi:broad specificity phosphatase PhoE
MNKSIYHITLLRHGESVGNAGNILQGQSDFPLSDKGKQQAHSLASHWKKMGLTFDLVISSTLARAKQTADILVETLNLPLELNPLWMERDIGHRSGLSHEQAELLYPRPPFSPLYLPLGETGESQWDVFLRAGSAVRDLISRKPGRYLVISHGGLLNMVLYAVLGISPQPNFHGARFRFRNAAYATLIFNPAEHDWLLDSLNRRDHWMDDED